MNQFIFAEFEPKVESPELPHFMVFDLTKTAIEKVWLSPKKIASFKSIIFFIAKQKFINVSGQHSHSIKPFKFIIFLRANKNDYLLQC
jgi:hypothetical protein